LLPHVPIIYNLDKSTFLKELCNKAGLDDEAWKNKDTCLYAFEAKIQLHIQTLEGEAVIEIGDYKVDIDNLLIEELEETLGKGTVHIT